MENQQKKSNLPSKGLSKIADKAGVTLLKEATRKTLKIPGGAGGLRGVDVVGGNLHNSVRQAGKFIGYKFKPWEAVGIAKNLGNAARFLGPAVAVVGLAAELHSQNEERKCEQEKINVRRDIQKQFQDLSVDIKSQIQGQLLEFEQQMYDDIQSLIDLAREDREFAISTNSSHQEALTSIRQDLNAALSSVKFLTLASS